MTEVSGVSEYPLSKAQQQVWFFQQLDPKSPLYNVPNALEIRGPLDVNVLRSAWLRVVQENPSLRILVVDSPSGARQVVESADRFSFRLVDRSGVDASSIPDVVRAEIAAEARRPFNLRLDLPVRVVIWRLGVHHHVLQATIHHIATDGWSHRVIEKRLWEIYAALRSNAPVPQVQPSRSYAQIVSDELAYQNSPRRRVDESYWREALRDAPPEEVLPYDRPRPATPTFCGAREQFMLPAELAERLMALCRASGTSVFSGFLAALQLYLARCGDSTDLVLGFLDARRGPSTMNTVGNLVNPLPLRIRLEDDMSFRAALSQHHRRVSEALEHGDLAFVDIVDVIKAERTNGRNPLFQVLVVYDMMPLVSAPDGLHLQHFVADKSTAKHDLTFFVAPVEKGMEMAVEYSSDLFDGATVRRLLEGFAVFLGAVVADPDAPVQGAPTMTPDDHHRVVSEWNATRRPYELGVTVPQKILNVARSTPDAPAVVVDVESGEDGTHPMTYGELDALSFAVARDIVAHGAERGDVVAVVLSRSPNMVAALLGAMRAGALVLPVDVEYPQARIAEILEDAAPVVVIADQAGLSRLTAHVGRILDISAVVVDTSPGPDGGPSLITGDDGAYVVYTSGSTGSPKGAVNTHVAFRNRLAWMQEQFGLSVGERVLHKTPIGFDVALWEVFWPLCEGAVVVLARPGGHRDPEYLLGLMERSRVTTVHFVPTMLQAVLRCAALSPKRLALTRVICSGEALTRSHVTKFRAYMPSVGLFNLYGPSEAAIDVTWWDSFGEPFAGPVPIGRPIANTQIYVLDSQCRPVPPGWPGELAIGGIAVGKGYLRRPEQTAQAFIDPQFPRSVTGPIYLTGDRARWTADGLIEFLGRRDDQVKIRGQRVELGEVETAIHGHADVSDATVIFQDDQLVAFVVPRPDRDAGPQAGKIRVWLRDRLPEYMVPSRFQFIKRIPYTPNGKVDKRRLAELPAVSDDEGKCDTGAWSPTERKIGDIWCAVLGRAQVGRDDSFFDVGGDSIRAIDVSVRFREQGIPLSLLDVFEARTISLLAERVRVGRTPLADEGTHHGPCEPFLDLTAADRHALPDDAVDAYPLTMLQTGLVYQSGVDEGYASYVTSLRVEARFDESRMIRALRHVTDMHPMLRTSVHAEGYSQPIQVVHATVEARLDVADCGWPIEDQASVQEHVAALVATLRDDRPMWAQAPLTRFQVHRLSPGSFQLTMVEPYLDGFSVATVLSEVLYAYGLLLAGEELPPTVPEHGFREFVALENQSISSQHDRDYWTQLLQDAPVARLPRWPSGAAARHVRHATFVEDDVVAGLERRAHEAGVPLKTVLMAAHVIVVGLLSGETDVVTGVMYNGRPETADGRRSVGLFLNALPMRLDVAEGTIEDLIHAVYQAEADGLRHRWYPVAQIARDLGVRPFETLFNYIHFHPYQHVADVGVDITDVQATDQTYFLLTAQFARSWMTGELLLSVDVNAKDIPDEEIAVFSDYYHQVLKDLAAADNGLVVDLRKPTAMDVELLDAWNATQPQSLEVDRAFIDAVRAQAQSTPHRVAVSDGTRELTYEELLAGAESAARGLEAYGARPGDVVAVLGKRSAEYLEVILGILAAGCAYLPLDPDGPDLRNRHTVEIAQARLVVTVCLDHRQAAAAFGQTPVVTSDDLATPSLDDRAPVRTHAEGVAYVIFTSGSTGKPKGTVVHHAGMLNHLWAKIEDLRIDETSVVAQSARQTFDISVWQFFAPLLVGGRVCVVDDETMLDVGKLARRVVDESVTVLQVVPSWLSVLLEAARLGVTLSEDFSSVRHFVVTGEIFEKALYDEVRSFLTHATIVNAYGPAECSDDVTHWLDDRSESVVTPSVPIGRPVRNMRIHVVDDKFHRVPVGAIGELVVEGIGVGSGYLGDPTRTANAFLNLPLGPGGTSVRCYRTGDRGRWLPTGELEFLGRGDRQVKIRGARIELGEVEYAARSLHGIESAHVLARSSETGTYLVAYVVKASGHPLTVEEIRQRLRSVLPQSMVPAHVVILPRLPLNAHGKVDASQLPDVEQTALDEEVRPLDDVERRLAAVWSDVLGCSVTRPNSDFFAMGGDSLRAMVLCARLAVDLGVSWEVADVFAHPTLADSARALDGCAALVRQLAHRVEGAVVSRSEATDSASLHAGTVRVESTPLTDQILAGRFGDIASASIGYIPEPIPEETGLAREEIRERWFAGLPQARSVLRTHLGTNVHITLPVFASELYAEPIRTAEALADGLHMARRLGAGTAALTGLLASATDLGRAAPKEPGILVTTGHDITAGIVLRNLNRLVELAGRRLEDLTLGFLGLGSVGSATLRLALAVAPHPQRLLLCDLYGRRNHLRTLAESLREHEGFRGEIDVETSTGVVPTPFYQADVIVGATNVADVLNIERIPAGTLVVDDSAPHCFNADVALQRFCDRGDILFTEGGLVAIGGRIEEIRYEPGSQGPANPFTRLSRFTAHRDSVMSCTAAGLILAADENLDPVLGPVSVDQAVRAYEALTRLKVDVPWPSCRDQILDPEIVSKFSAAVHKTP